MNNEQDVITALDDCSRYCLEQCHQYMSCSLCPTDKLHRCKLYFAKEYFKKKNLKIITKED